MATSATDILMFAMIAGGAGLVILNWKCLTDGTLCGLTGHDGDGTGQSGNCVYNDAKLEYTWQGVYTRCVSGKNKSLTANVSVKCQPGHTRTECCNAARSQFLANFPNEFCTIGGGCSGGWVKSGSNCICTPAAKGCGSSLGLIKTNTSCKCMNCAQAVCTTPGYKSVRNSQGYCQCVPGGGNITCTGCYTKNSTGTACQRNTIAGRGWLARVAVAILNRMCGGTCTSPYAPTISQVAGGYPSLLDKLAAENCSCNTNALNKQSSQFCKDFALLLGTINGDYHLRLTTSSKNAINHQYATGVWQLSGVDGGVKSTPFCSGSGFAEANRPNPFNDNRPGDSYGRALEGRYNRWNPYGDNRYAYTLPAKMKVQVS